MIKSRLSVIVYWALIIAMLGLFFTNDFGLVDIHKTSVVVAIGIDTEEEDVIVTAQIAVPQPSQSGDNIQYTEVQGRGLTIADCLNEINSKTGFYPKLLFCKLIIIGEECQSEELFRVLGCFYRRNYSELTAQVAMCKGKASEMLSLPATISPENSTAMQRALSEELKKSANVSSVNLKDLAFSEYSVSETCYMPFIEANVQGTSAGGGNGDHVGGDKPQQGESGGQSGGSSGSSGGSSEGSGGGGQSGQSGGSGGQSGQSGGSSSAGGEKVEFTARKTAVFRGGKFVGILNESQSFALNLIKNDIRLAVVPCDTEEGVHYTIGLKQAGGGVKLKVKDGVPELYVSFKAKAHIQGAKKVMLPESVKYDDSLKPEVLKAVNDEVTSRMQQLISFCAESDCDVLGVKQLLHKFHYKYFEAFEKDLLTRMNVNYKVDIKSLN